MCVRLSKKDEHLPSPWLTTGTPRNRRFSWGLGRLADLVHLGATLWAGSGGRRFAVLHGDGHGVLDVSRGLALEAVGGYGHVGSSPLEKVVEPDARLSSRRLYSPYAGRG